MSSSGNAVSPASREESLLPAGVDPTTVTAGGLYSPSEVREDVMQFGEWVTEGVWFIHRRTHTAYRLSPRQAPYTFVLERGIRVTQESNTDQTNSTLSESTYPIESVSELAGEILSGELQGVIPGEAIEVDGVVLSNTGEYLLVTPDTPVVDSLSDIHLPATVPNARHTDGSPLSLMPVVDSEKRDNGESVPQSAEVMIFSVNGSASAISHVLPQTTTSDSVRASSTPTAASDGGAPPGQGTVGVDSSITELPYFPSEDPDMVARFVTTGQHPSATFEDPNLRKYVLAYMQGRVLDACAGPTDLSQWYTDGKIVTNDIHPDIESDLSVDIAELACHLPPNSFDAIVFDPPWSAYQSRLRYNGNVVHKSPDDGLPIGQISIDIRDLPFDVPGELAVDNARSNSQASLSSYSESSAEEKQKSLTAEGEQMSQEISDYIKADTPKDQLGHSRLAKLGFNYLLRDGGVVIQFSYTGSIMPSAMGYKQIDRTTFNPRGTYKALCAGVDRKTSRL